jgi:hypothetical protein
MEVSDSSSDSGNGQTDKRAADVDFTLSKFAFKLKKTYRFDRETGRNQFSKLNYHSRTCTA